MADFDRHVGVCSICQAPASCDVLPIICDSCCEDALRKMGLMNESGELIDAGAGPMQDVEDEREEDDHA